MNVKYRKEFKERVAKLNSIDGESLSYFANKYNVKLCTVNAWVRTYKKK